MTNQPGPPRPMAARQSSTPESIPSTEAVPVAYVTPPRNSATPSASPTSRTWTAGASAPTTSIAAPTANVTAPASPGESIERVIAATSAAVAAWNVNVGAAATRPASTLPEANGIAASATTASWANSAAANATTANVETTRNCSSKRSRTAVAPRLPTPTVTTLAAKAGNGIV